MKMREKSLRQQFISFVITLALIGLAVYKLKTVTLINWVLIVIAVLELTGIIIRTQATGL